MPAVTFTATDVKPVSANSIRNTVIAGEAIDAGEAIYIKSADGKAYLAQANNGEKPASGEVAAIALTSAAADQILVYADADGTQIDFGAATFVAGEVYAVDSTVAGGIIVADELAATNYLVLLGYATTTAILQLLIRRTGIAK